MQSILALYRNIIFKMIYFDQVATETFLLVRGIIVENESNIYIANKSIKFGRGVWPKFEKSLPDALWAVAP